MTYGVVWGDMRGVRDFLDLQIMFWVLKSFCMYIIDYIKLVCFFLMEVFYEKSEMVCYWFACSGDF